MKTDKLFHKATGLFQDVPEEYVPAHLNNGWERTVPEPKQPKQQKNQPAGAATAAEEEPAETAEGEAE